MNIDTLVANLENTIAGKELLYNSIQNSTLRELVRINVDELKSILVDVKTVQEQVHQLEANLDGFVYGSL